MSNICMSKKIPIGVALAVLGLGSRISGQVENRTPPDLDSFRQAARLLNPRQQLLVEEPFSDALIGSTRPTEGDDVLDRLTIRAQAAA